MFSKARIAYGTIFSKFVNNPHLGRLPVNSSPSVSAKFISTEESPLVGHDRNNQVFFINFSEGQATLKYDIDKNVMRLYSTYVPPSLSGRGIGASLVKEALDYRERHNLQLNVECAFVKHYINKYEPHLRHYISNKDHH